MQFIGFSKLSFAGFLKRLIISVSVLVAVFISLYALFYKGLCFDGAFHAQAAMNLFKSGRFVLDYPVGHTEIKIPFQIVNGFFLTVFGMNFISANLANVLFYCLFGWLMVKLSKKFDSEYILIGFILISFSPGLLLCGFEGYGELPGLIVGLYGILLLTKLPVSNSGIFWGAFLIGTALATKWVFGLIFIPFGLLVLFMFLNKRFKVVIMAFLGLLVPLVLFSSLEYAHYSAIDLKQLFVNIIGHTTPVNKNYYSNYSERLLVFWQVYIQSSGSIFIAILKIIGYVQILITLIFLLITAIKGIKTKHPISSNQFFFLLLCVFAIEYFLWWFVLSSKPWYRRGYNADVLLIISLSISIKEIIASNAVGKVFRILAWVVILVICVFNTYEFFSRQSTNLLLTQSKGAIDLECKMREGLSKLPEKYKAYGYEWWQAPRWSFLSGVKHGDLWNLTIEDKYEIIHGSGKNFVFFEPVNFADEKRYKEVHELFKLSPIFEYKDYSIKKIDGINGLDSSIIKPFINYAESDYIWTEGVYPREKGYCWYSQNARILLYSKNKTEFVLSFHVPDIKKYSNNPNVSIYFNNEMVYKEEITSSGSFLKKIQVLKKYNVDRIIVNLQVSTPLQTEGDTRNLGIAIMQIGFR